MRNEIETKLKKIFFQSSEIDIDRAIDEIESIIGNQDLAFLQMQKQIEDLQETKEECLNLLEDTKNAYAWWIDEKYGNPEGIKCEADKRDHEHFENLKELLSKYGRTDH